MTQFTIGVLGVNLIAGLVLTIGPGRLLLDLAPHPRGTAKPCSSAARGCCWARP